MAQLCGRNTEAGVVRADAQVATQRESDRSAEAISVDFGNRRPVEVFEFGAHPRITRAGRAHCGSIGVPAVEFRNVGAGAEGFAAGPRDDNDADGAILCQIVEDPIEAIPHRHRDCIESRRIVEDDAGNRSFLAQNNLVVIHAGSFLRARDDHGSHIAACSPIPSPIEA